MEPGSSSATVRSLGGQSAFRRNAHGGYEVVSVTASSTAAVTVSSSYRSQDQKPQCAFQDCIDNSEAPFVAKLKTKHHSMVADEGGESDGHPYQYELDHFEVPARQLEPGEVKPFKPLNEVTCTLVKTEEQLKQLVGVLNGEKEFAVDVEHNHERSFLGITCLIQISTHDTDFIVDPFPLWRVMHLLNEPFSDPSILKVFHGSFSTDLLWLQRDFGVYVVNMFDTQVAMRMLGMEKVGLQHLVEEMCGVTLSKKLQRADWRLRPLPTKYVEYARSDTRYLLYCYDVLRNRLLESDNGAEKALLQSVYSASLEICRQRYEKPVFDFQSSKLARKARSRFSSRQLDALEELMRWRHATARKYDESPTFILQNDMLLRLAEALPSDQRGILECFPSAPYFVKKDLNLLHAILRKVHSSTCRPIPLQGPRIANFSKKRKQIDPSLFREHSDIASKFARKDHL